MVPCGVRCTLQREHIGPAMRPPPSSPTTARPILSLGIPRATQRGRTSRSPQLLRLLRCSVGGRRPQLAASRREQFILLERKPRERGQNPPNPNTSSAEARDQQE